MMKGVYFKMSEQWEKYYSRDQLKQLQMIELENLRAFVNACKELNIEYFVYGGTLLGVEKYKGLIPWDDDIDVALPRESYDIFIRRAPEILPDHLFLQNPYNCKECPYPYTKLRRKGTKYVEYANRNVNIDTGIYIDIYPVDKIPDDEKKRKRQFRKVQFWIRIYVCRQTPLYDRKVPGVLGPAKRVLKWVICKLARLLSQEFCINKIDHYMTLYNDCATKRYAALNSPNYNNIYCHLYPLEEGVFEGINVLLPGDYKTHLGMRYGDYSVLPKEEDRIGHVPYILDLGKFEDIKK